MCIRDRSQAGAGVVDAGEHGREGRDRVQPRQQQQAGEEMCIRDSVFLEQEAPQVEVSITVGGQRLAETVFETTVTVTVTTRINDKVVYLVEGTQAGIFEAANIPEEQLDPLPVSYTHLDVYKRQGQHSRAV